MAKGGLEDVHRIKLTFRIDVDEKNMCNIIDTYLWNDYESMVKRVIYALDAIRKCIIRGIIW